MDIMKAILDAVSSYKEETNEKIEARMNAHKDMIIVHAPNGIGMINYGNKSAPRLIVHGTTKVITSNLAALLKLHSRIEELSGTREHNEDLEADSVMATSMRNANHQRTRDELKAGISRRDRPNDEDLCANCDKTFGTHHGTLCPDDGLADKGSKWFALVSKR